MTFEQWTEAVDEICRRHLASSWADLCGDREPLEVAFGAGETPLEFVHWFAQKHDLQWVDPSAPVLSSPGSPSHFGSRPTGRKETR